MGVHVYMVDVSHKYVPAAKCPKVSDVTARDCETKVTAPSKQTKLIVPACNVNLEFEVGRFILL